MPLTRRSFLTRIGRAGGFGAAYMSMQMMGLLPTLSSEAETMPVAPSAGNGVSVVILGGGISGLVAAYELRALGYRCTVLEASSRPGGRNWTVRGGDTVTFIDGSTQHCEFNPGLYQNFGPARLPSNHHNMLGYCMKLNVPLEVEINTSRSTFLQNDAANGGKPVVQRQAINDTRGRISELLSKCVRDGALDQELTKEDRARMLTFLETYGPLSPSGKYVGSDRAGYLNEPGAGEDDGLFSEPLSMHMLLDENFWDGLLYEEEFDWQATMFQPVGGMDRIPFAFARELGDIVNYEAPVSEVRKTAKGVRVAYTQHGAQKSIDADFCICAMSLKMLSRVPSDLSPAYRKVVDESTYAGFYKIAWESERFWERDYNIFGGLEFVGTGCSPVWLPSAGLMSKRGVLVSGYGQEVGTPFESLTLQQKFAESRKSVERLHPGHGKELEKPMFVGWAHIPHIEGSWIESYGSDQRGRAPSDVVSLGHRIGGSYANAGYTTLLQPDGPIYFVGDHVSYLVGWQEGAALSSLRAVKMLNEKVQAAKA